MQRLRRDCRAALALLSAGIVATLALAGCAHQRAGSVTNGLDGWVVVTFTQDNPAVPTHTMGLRPKETLAFLAGLPAITAIAAEPRGTDETLVLTAGSGPATGLASLNDGHWLITADAISRAPR